MWCFRRWPQLSRRCRCWAASASSAPRTGPVLGVLLAVVQMCNVWLDEWGENFRGDSAKVEVLGLWNEQ